jgi:hypothetical protein
MEDSGDVFRVALVHLATEGLDKKCQGLEL